MRRRPIRDTIPEPITAAPHGEHGASGTHRSMTMDEQERRLFAAEVASLFGRKRR